MGCHTAKTVIQLLYIFLKKCPLGLGCSKDGFAILIQLMLFAPAQKTGADKAGPSTVGKHTLRGSFSHPNGGRQHFYYVFCRDTNHQTENSEVIFGLFLWFFIIIIIFCHFSHLFWFGSSFWKISHPLYMGLLNLLDWLVRTWQTS